MVVSMTLGRRVIRCSCVLLAFGCLVARAEPPVTQADAAKSAGQDGIGATALDEIVVTGTPTVSGVGRLDASFSITVAMSEEIRNANPSSAADLLKIVPGLWAESSGGQSGPNIEVAGFPGGGDAPYVTFQLNGSPLFPTPSLSFMDNSSLFRIDDTVERVEVLQGGPSVVFSNGQVGATADFILRQGGSVPHGDVAVTAGSEGLYRVDGFYGGPLAPDWFFSVGGFYRYSDGIRSPQFPADVGGQITATISHKLESGSVLVFARTLNDKNLFISDIPVSVSPDGRNVSAFPGFDPNTGTFAGNALRNLTVEEFPGAPPGTLSGDLASGRGADIHIFGANFDWSRFGLAFSNKIAYTAGNVPTNALFNNLAPGTLGAFISEQVASANNQPSVVSAAGRPATSGTATWVGGTAVDPGTQVASLGFWVVDKRIRAVTDDLRASADLFSGNSITVGGYFADYSSDDTWYLGNNLLVSATPNAQLINLALDNNVQVTQDGVLSGSFFSLVDRYSGRNLAFFASDQWHSGRWLADAGFREENQRIDGTIENDSSVDLDGNPLTLYNNGTSVAGGGWMESHYNHTLGSWTLGLNYEITPAMSAFARVNEGYHLPSFDDLRGFTTANDNGNSVPAQKVENQELGYKADSTEGYVVVDVFHRRLSGVAYDSFLTDGSQIKGYYGSTAYGVGIEGRWEPVRDLSFVLTGTWQDATYADYPAAALNGTTLVSYTGSVLQRQPRVQLRFTPEYSIPARWGSLSIFATMSYVGLRYSNPGDLQVLPAYYTLDAGIIAKVADRYEIRLQGSNLTDQIGLTEGNARVTTSGITGGFEMARPIFGREGQLQLRYMF